MTFKPYSDKTSKAWHLVLIGTVLVALLRAILGELLLLYSLFFAGLLIFLLVLFSKYGNPVRLFFNQHKGVIDRVVFGLFIGLIIFILCTKYWQ